MIDINGDMSLEHACETRAREHGTINNIEEDGQVLRQHNVGCYRLFPPNIG